MEGGGPHKELCLLCAQQCCVLSTAAPPPAHPLLRAWTSVRLPFPYGRQRGLASPTASLRRTHKPPQQRAASWPPHSPLPTGLPRPGCCPAPHIEKRHYTDLGSNRIQARGSRARTQQLRGAARGHGKSGGPSGGLLVAGRCATCKVLCAGGGAFHLEAKTAVQVC